MKRTLLLLLFAALPSAAQADALLLRAESSIDSDDLEVRRGLAGYRMELGGGREAGVDAWHRQLVAPGSDQDGQAAQAVVTGTRWRLAAGVERMDNGWTLPVADGFVAVPWRGNEIELFAETGLVETPQAIAAEVDAQLAGVIMTREIGAFTLAGGGHLRRFADGNARQAGLLKGLWRWPGSDAVFLGLRWQGQQDDMASPVYFSPEEYQRLQAVLLWKGVLRDTARWRVEARTGQERIVPFGLPEDARPSHALLLGIDAAVAVRTRADCALTWQDAAASDGGYEYTQVVCGLRREF